MAEPSLLTLLLQSAAKALGGAAVRATTSRWKQIYERVRPAPAVLKRYESWKESGLTEKQKRAIGKFLSSRQCVGLLELLTFLEIDRSGFWSSEKESLERSFKTELIAELDMPDHQSARIAAELWRIAEDCIRLEIADINRTSSFVRSDFGYIKRRLELGPMSSQPLLNAIDERIQLSADNSRVMAAHGAVDAIQDAMVREFGSLQMPHSRDDYRIPITSLYVDRLLEPSTVGEDRHEIIINRHVSMVEDTSIYDRRFVVIGNPGAGKSTFVKYSIYRTAASKSGTSGNCAPFLLELKDIPTPKTSYVTHITARLAQTLQLTVVDQTVEDILTLGHAVVIFDGLDEIASVADRRATVRAIEAFSDRFPLVQVIVTCRREGYTGAMFDPEYVSLYHLPDYDQSQVVAYVTRWFSLTKKIVSSNTDATIQSFLSDSEHVSELRSNPLMLSLLCIIYEHEGWIPENRLQVFKECTALLFERWDRVRKVPPQLKRNKKTWFLFQELAHYFFRRPNTQGGEAETALRQVLVRYFQEQVTGNVFDAWVPAHDFFDYCSGRAWLLVQVGRTNKGERLFDFAHRTFMEYLTACWIVRHSQNAGELADTLYPIILSGASDVVAQLAMQEYEYANDGGLDSACEALLSRRKQEDAKTILSFILRSLTYVQPSAAITIRIAEIAISYIDVMVDEELAALVFSLPADVKPLFEKVARASMGTSSGLTHPTARMYVGGAIVILSLFDDGVAYRKIDAIRLTSAEYVSNTWIGRYGSATFGKLASISPTAINHLLNRGLISLERYVEVLGIHSLVEQPGNRESCGPLLLALFAFLDQDSRRFNLSAMLRLAAEKEDGIVPLRKYTADRIMVEFVKRGQGPPVEMSRLEQAVDPVAPQAYLALHLAAACALFEYIGEVAKEVGKFIFYDARSDSRARMTRLEFGQHVIKFLDRHGGSGNWGILFRKWQRNEVSFRSHL